MSELDVLLRDHVTPLLRAEGFRKSGHTYRQTSAGGDSMIVGFRDDDAGLRCNFLVDVAFVPQPLLEMHNWSQGTRLDAPTQANWITWGMPLHNHAHPRLSWEYDSESERRQCIDELVHALPRALRVLRLLADRDLLLDVVRAPVELVSPGLPGVDRRRGGAGGFRMALLVERGPSDNLRPFLDFYATGPFRSYAEWAEARLAAGHPLVEELHDAPRPRSTESYQPLQQALDAALDRFVTPGMAAAGFDRIPGGYERWTARGDRAAVDVRLSATATEEALAFTVVSGLSLAPSGFSDALHPTRPDSARLSRVNPAACSVDWLVAQLRPTPAFASVVPELAQVGLHPWSVPTDGAAEGMGLLARMLAESTAPFLTSMLDRSALLEFVKDPAHRDYSSPWTPQLRVALLLLDEQRPAELAEALDAVRQTRGRHHREFVDWVGRRGRPEQN